MKNFNLLFLAIILIVIISSCSETEKYAIEVDEVSPWCILGFDSVNRNPEERIAMLKEMGIKKYGYNRGKGDFSAMKQEFQLAKENNIEITSVFLWLNAKRDSIGKLSPANKLLIENLKEVDYKPTIWLSFSNNFFEKINQEESILLSSDMISFIKSKADSLGCKLALYNHNGWFGNPYNQVQVIETLNDESISMVYNFHHAHEYIDEFPDIVKKIKPYLSFVNLNGLEKNGEKILPIGSGDYEFDMIKLLMDEGYNGPWGILGHIKTEDVQVVLDRNLAGLNAFNSKKMEKVD